MTEKPQSRVTGQKQGNSATTFRGPPGLESRNGRLVEARLCSRRTALVLVAALGMSSDLPKPRPNPAHRVPSRHCWCALCRCAPEPAILGLEDNHHETLRGESRRIFILVATDLRLLSSTACPVRPYRCSLVCPAVVTACAPSYPSRCHDPHTAMTLSPRLPAGPTHTVTRTTSTSALRPCQ